MKLCFISTLFLLSLNAYSQEDVHLLINQDKLTDCKYIKSGRFVHEKSCDEITEGYTIEFRDKYVVEKIEDGKYYVKSAITYTSDCSYTSKVLETNIPGYEDQIGKVFYSEILETAKMDKLVMIRSKIDEWRTLVLRKIED